MSKYEDKLKIIFKNVHENGERKTITLYFPKEEAGKMAVSIMLAAFSPTCKYVEVEGK